MYTCWYSYEGEEIYGQSVLHNTVIFNAIVKVSIFNQHIICQWTWRITVRCTLSKLTLSYFKKSQSKNINWGQFPECLFQHPFMGWLSGDKKKPIMYNIMHVNKHANIIRKSPISYLYIFFSIGNFSCKSGG